MRGAAVTLDIVTIVVTPAVDLTKRREPYRSIPSSCSLGGSTVISPILQMWSPRPGVERRLVPECHQACLTPELIASTGAHLLPGVAGAWLHPESPGREQHRPRRPEAGTPAFRCWPMALCPSHLATAEVSWALAWLVCRAQLFLPSACRVPGAQRCSNPPHLCPEARPAAGLPQGLKKDPYRLGSPQGPSFLPCFSLWPGDLLAGPAGCEGDPGCLGEGSSEQKPE